MADDEKERQEDSFRQLAKNMSDVTFEPGKVTVNWGRGARRAIWVAMRLQTPSGPVYRNLHEIPLIHLEPDEVLVIKSLAPDDAPPVVIDVHHKEKP